MRRSSAPSQIDVPLKRAKLDNICSALANTESKENSNGSSPENPQTPPDGKKYFGVLWAKASTRKHKKWEAAGVIIVGTRTVDLRDEKGKLISSAIGYKLSQLENLELGSTLMVGGKEIEVQSSISASYYASGKCFSESAIEPSNESHLNTKQNSRLLKPSSSFKNPSLSSTNSQVLISPQSPLFDPLAPGALVMPRPPSQLQLKHSHTNIVDVVVDTHLSRHLRPHQREGAIFMYECVMGFKPAIAGHGVILADEMGLGKTLQCITLIWTLLKQGPYGGKKEMRRALVVCPCSVVKTWEQQFKKWLGNERISVFTVDKNNKVADFARSTLFPVLIISYEMFVRNFVEIEAISDIDLVVFDEAHRLKNAEVKAASCAAQLMCDRKVLLTGTPIQNDLKELYTLVSLANPGVLGPPKNFQRLYEDPIVASQQPNCSHEIRIRGENVAAQLTHTLSLFVLRRTMEVNDAFLPPKTENVVFCPLTPKQAEAYQKFSNSALFPLFSGFPGGLDHFACISALRKLCNHPNLIKLEEEDTEEDIESLQAVREIITESLESVPEEKTLEVEVGGKMRVLSAFLKHFMCFTNEKIVLVSHFTKMLDIFMQFCDASDFSYLRLDGSTEANKRQSAVDRFNSSHGSERIFLLSAKAGGLGLNLTGASHLILYDIDWNPAHDIQAMARIRRDGQKHHVQIYRFITSGTIEENIFKRQTVKQGLSGAVVDSRQLTKGSFSKEELKDLMTLKEGMCETHEMLFCACDKKGKHQLRIDYSEEEEDDRPYQIRAVPRVAKKHKTMDQLLLWEHYEGPIGPGVLQDPSLEAAGQFVSFVFRSTSDGVKVNVNKKLV